MSGGHVRAPLSGEHIKTVHVPCLEHNKKVDGHLWRELGLATP